MRRGRKSKSRDSVEAIPRPRALHTLHRSYSQIGRPQMQLLVYAATLAVDVFP